MKMRIAGSLIVALVFFPGLSPAFGASRPSQAESKVLIKNWALAACMAEIAKDPADKEDANLSASAYFEQGRLGVEDLEPIMSLVKQFAARKYGGSVPGDYNTMKCIDLFYSKELSKVVNTLVKN
jgi:hypothetical protein